MAAYECRPPRVCWPRTLDVQRLVSPGDGGGDLRFKRIALQTLALTEPAAQALF